MLLSFECYAWALDWVEVLTPELRPPFVRQAGVIAPWTVTLFPAAANMESKTRMQDGTVTVGTSNERRAWLVTLCQPLLDVAIKGEPLLGLTSSIYLKLFRQCHETARCPHTAPHRFRHGAASAEVFLGGPLKLTDLEMAGRGR